MVRVYGSEDKKWLREKKSLLLNLTRDSERTTT